MTKKGEKLTPKQQIFVSEYLKMTPKQQIFVSEYLKTGNATEAARRAGYKGNDNTLGQVGNENLRKPKVVELIKSKEAERSKRLELEEDFELKAAKEIYDKAMEILDFKSANTAIQTIAKIRGKFIQKIQLGVSDDIAGMLGRIKIK